MLRSAAKDISVGANKRDFGIMGVEPALKLVAERTEIRRVE